MRVLLIAALISLAGCVSISKVETGDRTVGERMTVTLDGRDSSFLEWVGAAAPSLARPGGAMHEVAASPLIAAG